MTPECAHMGCVSMSRNGSLGGYWICTECGTYLGGVFFGNGPAREVDTLDEARQLGIAL